jgi:hypothetical protein
MHAFPKACDTSHEYSQQPSDDELVRKGFWNQKFLFFFLKITVWEQRERAFLSLDKATLQSAWISVAENRDCLRPENRTKGERKFVQQSTKQTIAIDNSKITNEPNNGAGPIKHAYTKQHAIHKKKKTTTLLWV